MPGKKKEIENLDTESQKPDFWQDLQKAKKLSKKLADLKKETEEFAVLKNEFEAVKELDDGELLADFEEKLKKAELKIFLSGKYDSGNAILSIYAGAGGQDSQDWATMLLRMYERYCGFKRFKTKILHQSFGDPGGPEGRIGTKSVTMEVEGNFAYGFLKKETGVHRLVRLSPFSSQKLRHTSFATVEVLPQIEESESDIEIKPEDINIDFYRASGPGGQNVNKRETSVRITHLKTGIVVACQSERQQGDNRKKAMELLIAKLFRLQEEERQKEMAKIKGGKISGSWGNQIRNYVLHPYKLVKDLRTNIEVSNPEKILDGDLEEFIQAEIQLSE